MESIHRQPTRRERRMKDMFECLCCGKLGTDEEELEAHDCFEEEEKHYTGDAMKEILSVWEAVLVVDERDQWVSLHKWVEDAFKACEPGQRPVKVTITEGWNRNPEWFIFIRGFVLGGMVGVVLTLLVMPK